MKVLILFLVWILLLISPVYAQVVEIEEIMLPPHSQTNISIPVRNQFDEQKVFDVACSSTLRVECPTKIQIPPNSYSKLNLKVYTTTVDKYEIRLSLGNKSKILKVRVSNLPVYLESIIDYYEKVSKNLNGKGYEIVGIEKLYEAKELYELKLYSEAKEKLDEFIESFSVAKTQETRTTEEEKYLIGITQPVLLTLIPVLCAVSLYIFVKKVRSFQKIKPTFSSDLEKIRKNIQRQKQELIEVPPTLPEAKRKLLERYIREGKHRLAKLLLDEK